MKNGTKRLIAILIALGAFVINEGLTALMAYVIQPFDLYDDEMAKCMIVPIISFAAFLVFFNIWFSSKEAAFTNGKLIEYSLKNYGVGLWITLTYLFQILLVFGLAVVLMLPYVAVGAYCFIYQIPGLLFVLGADILAYIVFRPFSKSYVS